MSFGQLAFVLNAMSQCYTDTSITLKKAAWRENECIFDALWFLLNLLKTPLQIGFAFSILEAIDVTSMWDIKTYRASPATVQTLSPCTGVGLPITKKEMKKKCLFLTTVCFKNTYYISRTSSLQSLGSIIWRNRCSSHKSATLLQWPTRLCRRRDETGEAEPKHREQNTLGIMGVTCNYFIALKIPELLVSVYRARAWQGHKLQPLALAPNAQQSRTGPSFLPQAADGPRIEKWKGNGWKVAIRCCPVFVFPLLSCDNQIWERSSVCLFLFLDCLIRWLWTWFNSLDWSENNCSDLMWSHVVKKPQAAGQTNSRAPQSPPPRPSLWSWHSNRHNGQH